VLGIAIGAGIQEFLKRRKLDVAEAEKNKVEVEKNKLWQPNHPPNRKSKRSSTALINRFRSRPDKKETPYCFWARRDRQNHPHSAKCCSTTCEPRREGTASYEIYQGANTAKRLAGLNDAPNNDQATYYFYISDYMGTNIGTLVGSFIEQQFTLYSPMAYATSHHYPDRGPCRPPETKSEPAPNATRRHRT